MPFVFEELDSVKTPIGLLSLRKRSELRLGGKVLYEVKLGDEFLMSSLFTEAEIQLSRLGIKTLQEAGHLDNLDIVVGGLGLGYTALAALESDGVRSVTVIELMEAVIDWHRRGLLPIGDSVAADPRCTLQQGDFFAIATASESSFATDGPEKVHGVFLDIDHSPTNWLNPQNSEFYSADSLRKLSDKLLPGGVFGLWSDDPPEEQFVELLETVFESARSEVVTFPNPLTLGESSNTVYLATNAR